MTSNSRLNFSKLNPKSVFGALSSSRSESGLEVSISFLSKMRDVHGTSSE